MGEKPMLTPEEQDELVARINANPLLQPNPSQSPVSEELKAPLGYHWELYGTNIDGSHSHATLVPNKTSTRPTADLGEDRGLVGKLRNYADNWLNVDVSELSNTMLEAADRIESLHARLQGK